MPDTADPSPNANNGAHGAGLTSQATPGTGGFPGEGFHAPIFPSRDPSDPLSLEKLRETELTVEQSIAFYDRLTRIARNPRNEPGYAQVVAALVRYQSLYRDLNVMAESRYNRYVRLRDMVAKLDMGNVENIRAYAEFAEAADFSLLVWRQVYSMHQKIHKSLYGNDNQVAAAPAHRRIDELTA